MNATSMKEMVVATGCQKLILNYIIDSFVDFWCDGEQITSMELLAGDHGDQWTMENQGSHQQNISILNEKCDWKI